MKVSRSAYYDWIGRPKKTISAEDFEIRCRMKELFTASRGSLGSREMMKNLRKEGFSVGRYRVRSLMKDQNLKVTQRVAFRVTTKRNRHHGVAPNLVNQNFNPEKPNQIWAGDITYLKTAEGWLYLAVVMDLCSRRIVGWKLSTRMTEDLVIDAFNQAYVLRRPRGDLVFHSDRGSQYTGGRMQACLQLKKVIPSMGDVGACWDNAVVERFFGSLKYDWILKVDQPSHAAMKEDVTDYMHYYNLKRLHTFNDGVSPAEFERILNQAA